MGMSFKNVARVASAALALAAVETAQASLIIDFQFDSAGTISKNIGVGNATVQVQVWATVSIAPTDTGLVGFGNAVFRAQSQQVSGGAFTTGGAMTFAPVTSPYAMNNTFTKGQTVDINGDGLRDLGVASGAVSTLDAKARSQVDPVNGTTPAYFSDQDGGSTWTVTATTAKIQLGFFRVVVGTLGTGTTKFNVALPNFTNAASWFENVDTNDSNADGFPDGETGQGNSTSPTTGAFTAGTSVSFVVTGAAKYNYALTTHNDATLGTLHSKSLLVVGNNGNYNDPGPDSNYVPADGTLSSYTVNNPNLGAGGEVPVLVMVEFNLGTSGLNQATLKAKLANASGDGTPLAIVGLGDADPLNAYNTLIGQYPTFINDSGHVTYVFEYTALTGAVGGQLAFGFDMNSSNVSVARVVIVPEPASLGLLALGGLGLLKRRKQV